MNTPNSFRMGLLLARLFFQPVAWAKWLLVASLVLAIIAVPLHVVLPDAFMITASLWLSAILAGAYFFIGFAFLPGQVLSIGSSKQLYMLANFRNYALAVFAGVCAFVTLLIVTTVMLNHRDMDWLALLLSVFLLITIFFMVFLMLAKYFNGAQFVVFWIPGLGIKTVQWLMLFNPLMLAAVCALLWVIFVRWWLQWKPARFNVNMLSVSASDIARVQGMQFNCVQGWLNNSISLKPKTIVGTFLFNVPDSLLAHAYRAVIALAIFNIVLLAMMFMGVPLVDFLGHMGGFWLFMMLVSFSLGYLSTIFRNIHKAWLYCDDRRSVVVALETFFMQALLPNTLVACAAVFILNKVCSIELVNPGLLLLIVLQSIVLVFVLLYLGLVVYAKSKASLHLNMWANMVVFIFANIAVVAANIFWGGEYRALVLQLAVALIVAQTLALIPLRRWALSCIARADFVRGKA